MELEKQFKLIDQVCSLFKGTREEHVKIQNALIAIEKELFKEEKKDVKT